MTKLTFIDVMARRGETGRKSDLASFEYTYQAEITNVYPLTETEKLYQIQLVDEEQRRNFHFKPGQFVMLELPGIGEAPFSISSSPAMHGDLELCIRGVGNMTNFLARVPRGTMVGISGPFGSGFPVERMYGHNVMLIAGGLGLVPLRAPIASVLENRSRYGAIDIIYGARNPSELLFTYQYEMWKRFDLNLSIIVDQGDENWSGPVGRITSILEKRIGAAGDISQKTSAIVCGPPVMFKFVCDMLIKADMPMQRIFVSLERRMHCGRGKCCRCNIGSTYTCLEGPVFDYWSVMNMKEAI